MIFLSVLSIDFIAIGKNIFFPLISGTGSALSSISVRPRVFFSEFVSMFAMSASAVMHTRMRAALSDGILRIVFLSADKQMCRIYTRWIVAAVENLKRTIERKVKTTRGHDSMSQFAAKSAVVKLISSSIPFPATGFSYGEKW